MGVKYIDIRQAFLNAEGFWGKIINSGYLTKDGEHENERGTQIVANKFAEVLKGWLKSKTSPPTRSALK